jgi:hypothetical protein
MYEARNWRLCQEVTDNSEEDKKQHEEQEVVCEHMPTLTDGNFTCFLNSSSSIPEV